MIQEYLSKSRGTDSHLQHRSRHLHPKCNHQLSHHCFSRGKILIIQRVKSLIFKGKIFNSPNKYLSNLSLSNHRNSRNFNRNIRNNNNNNNPRSKINNNFLQVR